LIALARTIDIVGLGLTSKEGLEKLDKDPSIKLSTGLLVLQTQLIVLGFVSTS
jgi:hypothetical protein